MDTVITVIVLIMAVVSMGLMILAALEFVKDIKDKKNDSAPTNVEPIVQRYIYTPVAPTAPAEAPAPAAATEPAPAEEPARANENEVAFGVSMNARKTLLEEYDALTETKKKWYDRIAKTMDELEKIRIKELKFARAAVQGQDTVARLQFVKGEICVDCTLVNADLKSYSKAQGTKIKAKPMRFRITDEQQLDAAIYTMGVANQTALDARMKKKAKKAEA